MPAPIPEKAAAIAAGETTYFTGKPCKKGHVSPRFVSGSQCIECNNQHSKRGRIDNPGRHAAYQRAARQRDPSKNQAATRKYRAKNPTKVLESTRQWRNANWGKYLFLSRIYSSVRRAKKTDNGGSFTVSDVDLIYESQGGKCIVCGSAEHLELDHIIPIARGGSSAPSNLQLLCLHCNRSKRDKTMEEFLVFRSLALLYLKEHPRS